MLVEVWWCLRCDKEVPNSEVDQYLGGASHDVSSGGCGHELEKREVEVDLPVED